MIAIGSDHGGFELKEKIKKHLEDRGLEYRDYGTFSDASVDYPTYGIAVGEAVARGECEKGILVCGTGIGISMAANKVDIVDLFLDTPFEGGRHQRRIDMITEYENKK